jgi:outer membrane putative beta-barrel porin/alpha-amylase
MNNHSAIVCAGAVALALSAGAARASCGSAFCSINTNWNLQGAWTEPGMRLDLRYEYIRQDQLMAGNEKISVGQIPRHHDEVSTVNRNWLGTLDYAFDSSWGASITVPVVDREHLHIHNHQGAQLPERWDFTELGDVRVLGRYQLPAQEGAGHELNFFGLDFGLKLPTGKFNVANADGDKAERTLQPGSGTTDVLLGAYFRQSLPLESASWFAQGMVQAALNTREEFRPGPRLTLDLGVRYELSQNTGLVLQVNSVFRGRDSGAEAEPEDSGGRFLFVSSGISYALTKDMQVYGFAQLPAYQFVNGVQLVATRAYVLGVSGRF